MSALGRWLLASFIALLLSSLHLMDSPSDLDAIQDVATDLHHTIVTAKADHE